MTPFFRCHSQHVLGSVVVGLSSQLLAEQSGEEVRNFWGGSTCRLNGKRPLQYLPTLDVFSLFLRKNVSPLQVLGTRNLQNKVSSEHSCRFTHFIFQDTRNSQPSHGPDRSRQTCFGETFTFPLWMSGTLRLCQFLRVSIRCVCFH